MAKAPKVCRWVTLREALTCFVRAEGGTQSAEHIKPLHWYVACRLVLEGGFDPDDISPRPPFVVARRAGDLPLLIHDQAVGGTGELTILGGLKTKDVDVAVAKEGIGPCIAISMKGTLNAFRNLTNRMEEAAGDCTNLHMSYPALVYGFWNVLRANREGPVSERDRRILKEKDGQLDIADVAIFTDGRIANSIVRYHHALTGLGGRDGIRDDVSRYEAVALSLVSADGSSAGEVVDEFPTTESPLRWHDFFSTVYGQYDLRFIYQAPALEKVTRRLEWSPKSPVLEDARVQGFDVRVAD